MIRTSGLVPLSFIAFGLLISGCSESDTPAPAATTDTTQTANPVEQPAATPEKPIAPPTPAKIDVKQQTLPAIPKFIDFPAGPPRKQAFFDFMTPLVHRANDAVLEKRHRLQSIILKNDPSQNDQAWLKAQADLYGVEPFDFNQAADRTALLKRIDKVPTALALAQGANESAWGTSRFARQANNYFGQWCFTEGCGLVPKQRSKGAIHEVRAFKHPYDSVVSYIHNLNSHSTYAKLRSIRAKTRADNQPLTGLEMAEGLVNYSARKHEYVKELQSMIRYNKLTQYNQKP
jgi:Bax protein